MSSITPYLLIFLLLNLLLSTTIDAKIRCPKTRKAPLQMDLKLTFSNEVCETFYQCANLKTKTGSNKALICSVIQPKKTNGHQFFFDEKHKLYYCQTKAEKPILNLKKVNVIYHLLDSDLQGENAACHALDMGKMAFKVSEDATFQYEDFISWQPVEMDYRCIEHDICEPPYEEYIVNFDYGDSSVNLDQFLRTKKGEQYALTVQIAAGFYGRFMRYMPPATIYFGSQKPILY